ncbi:MAG TPA: YfiR family protein [Bacteroidia bacterium]|nr:YfiR family protein [Bacteroidia bacterium]HNP99124.1 YfiR family protein [Bacteroidia bacterium]
MSIRPKIKHTIQSTFRKGLVLVVFLLIGTGKIYSQSNEADIKAMFLFNFIKYVEWPKEQEASVFKIGIVGKSSVSDALQKVIAMKKKEGKKLELVQLNPENAPTCQLVFVTAGEESHGEMWAKQYQGRGVLLVSEESEHSEKWAAINLVKVENKIRFVINLSAAKSGGIKISSQLSSLAILVNP